jgi:hypothetical protein
VSDITDVQRADLIVERLARDPRVQQIVADARLFDSLRAEPGWQRLFSMVQAKKGKWMDSVSKRLMGAQKQWPKPEEIAYHQGFYQGAVFVLAHPEYAEHNLENAAKVAWAMSFGDEDDDDTFDQHDDQEVDQ